MGRLAAKARSRLTGEAVAHGMLTRLRKNKIGSGCGGLKPFAKHSPSKIENVNVFNVPV